MNSLLRMHSFLCRSVKSLTLICVISLSGCAYIHEHYGETCNSHAYIKQDLEDYITTRYSSSAPVRMAIIPFSVPANLSTKSPEFPGVDRQLAQGMHATLLDYQIIPIIEVLNRQDWPGKKEEFYTGNFGAIALAREAGYDIVMVGYVERPNNLTSLTTHTKIIEVESGITLYYGRSTVSTRQKEFESIGARVGLATRRPDLVYTTALVQEMSRCVAGKIMRYE